jgi:hypothetical protein
VTRGDASQLTTVFVTVAEVMPPDWEGRSVMLYVSSRCMWSRLCFGDVTLRSKSNFACCVIHCGLQNVTAHRPWHGRDTHQSPCCVIQTGIKHLLFLQTDEYTPPEKKRETSLQLAARASRDIKRIRRWCEELYGSKGLRLESQVTLKSRLVFNRLIVAREVRKPPFRYTKVCNRVHKSPLPVPALYHANTIRHYKSYQSITASPTTPSRSKSY